jgi:hypothetical protein
MSATPTAMLKTTTAGTTDRAMDENRLEGMYRSRKSTGGGVSTSYPEKNDADSQLGKATGKATTTAMTDDRPQDDEDEAAAAGEGEGGLAVEPSQGRDERHDHEGQDRHLQQQDERMPDEGEGSRQLTQEETSGDACGQPDQDLCGQTHLIDSPTVVAGPCGPTRAARSL